MRKSVLGVISFLLLASGLAFAAPQQQTLTEAARKAREQKKNQPKPARVYTNDDLDTVRGQISVVGAAVPAKGEGAAKDERAGAEAAGEKAGKPEEEKKDEAYWRRRFGEARGKLRQAEKELDILQRELNLKQTQYYSDPNTALREQFERTEVNKYRKDIQDKQAEVEKLRQGLADLEGELRRSGGDPGWARE